MDKVSISRIAKQHSHGPASIYAKGDGGRLPYHSGPNAWVTADHHLQSLVVLEAMRFFCGTLAKSRRSRRKVFEPG